ncbi:MAG: FAD-dependent oxidoreductase [Thermodesulfobacteriota bacterium]
MGVIKAIVLGSGVSGLTCGIRLLEEGFNVRIAAFNFPPHTTSDIAPAYWYPYKVAPQDSVLKWAEFSYEKFEDLTLLPESGISMTELFKIFDQHVEDPFWGSAVRSYRRAASEELPPGYVDGFVTVVPRIETPAYMKYLLKSYADLGGEIKKLDIEADSLEELSLDRTLVVNCAGLGGGKLCGDGNTFPIRGQIVRVSNIGLKRVVSVESGRLAPIYIVPRNEDCILGGTAEENDWNLNIDPDTSDQILKKCMTIEPALAGAEVIGHRVGLRPGRTEVRLETEKLPGGRTVIHNYGHGGAGFTLSWGCAEDVLKLAVEYASAN